MLKRITHIALILLLIVATTGVTISRHYCGNYLIAVSLFKSVKCACGDKDCHNEIKQIKVTDNYSASEVLHSSNPLSIEIPSVVFAGLGVFHNPAYSSSFFFIKAPPLQYEKTLSLLQSFRC
jgi:hypothetical protein